jgi:hypothetical protein
MPQHYMQHQVIRVCTELTVCIDYDEAFGCPTSIAFCCRHRPARLADIANTSTARPQCRYPSLVRMHVGVTHLIPSYLMQGFPVDAAIAAVISTIDLSSRCCFIHTIATSCAIHPPSLGYRGPHMPPTQSRARTQSSDAVQRVVVVK